MLAEEGLKGAAEGREGFASWGRRAKVGGGMSLGLKGPLALQKPNFSKSSGVALGGLCWGSAEIQQCCPVLCGSLVPSQPWEEGRGWG